MSNGKIKGLQVSTPQGESGRLVKESRFSFNYTTDDRSSEVSLLMPIRAESYAGSVLPSVFAMNRPEGYLLDKIRERFGKHFDLDDMRLLAITGQNQIGRLRYSEPGTAGEQRGAEVGLSTLLNSKASEGLFDYLVDVYLQSGISGFQPKIMIPDADKVSASSSVLGGGGTASWETAPLAEKSTAVTPDLIVKSAGEDYAFLAQNEYLCMSAAKQAGITVPDFWLSEDGSLFVMRRFDLEGPERKQLGFEDMAVLTTRTAEQKYHGSYEEVAKMIGAYCKENRVESQARFFEYVALSVMTRNGDAHLKNFGLLYEFPNGAPPRLAPLFDVVTTTVYPIRDPQSGRMLTDRELALNLHKKKDYPTRKNLVQFGRNVCGVPKPEVVLDRIEAAMRDVLKSEARRIDSGFLQTIKSEWEGGCSAVAAPRIFAAHPRKAP
ncbi:phosphatidylinositol kinase [Pandoraea terrae]|uniref:Phosphatidylinositol kinase n=1 Tax=Pandoraea terrae TaxID=1537710 RepID=A0A5E4UJF2_9BURK|nr:type II toxin-antitoxin system HipA family toxin [Pandoraea terrae]VVE00046.1 phosphatidylinositol kinase [Pandoraea terrae]